MDTQQPDSPISFTDPKVYACPFPSTISCVKSSRYTSTRSPAITS